jgi:regulator of protease activity HflC (stomatin/prohibitin superfamily)
MATGISVVVAIAVIFVLSGLKILNEYERSVVFRLGRLILPKRAERIRRNANVQVVLRRMGTAHGVKGLTL